MKRSINPSSHPNVPAWKIGLILSLIFAIWSPAKASTERPVVYFLPGVFDTTVVDMRIESMRFLTITMEALGDIDPRWQTQRVAQEKSAEQLQQYLISTRTQWLNQTHKSEMKNRLLGYLPVADYLVYLEMDQPGGDARWVYLVIFPLRDGERAIALEREKFILDENAAANIEQAAQSAAQKIYDKIQELIQQDQQKQNQRQVVFVVDESETMKANDPDLIRADVIDFMIQNILNDFDQVGIVGFNSQKHTRTILPLTTVGELGQQMPAQKIQNQREGGKYTNLYAGLQRASQLLNLASESAECQAVILLSDGITQQDDETSELDIDGLKKLKMLDGINLGKQENEIHTTIYETLLPRLLGNFRQRQIQFHTITFANENGRGFTFMEDIDRSTDQVNDALIITTRFDSLYAQILTQTLNPQRCNGNRDRNYYYESVQLQRGRNYKKFLDVSREPADLRTDIFFNEKVDFSDGKPEVILYTPDNQVYDKTSPGIGQRSSISFFVPQDSIAKYVDVPGRWRIEITQVDVNIKAVVGYEWIAQQAAPLLMTAWVDPNTNEWFFETNDVDAMMDVIESFLQSPQFQDWSGKMVIRGTEKTMTDTGEIAQPVEIIVEKETPESEPVITRSDDTPPPPEKNKFWWWIALIALIVIVGGVGILLIRGQRRY